MNPSHVDVAKRRKTSGLNSRFDRMIETLNIAHPSRLDKSVHSRARSTSSTSGSSIPPRTPIDDYDEFHREATQRRLGADFSVIKMDTASNSIPRKNKTNKLPWDQDSSSSDISEVAFLILLLFIF